MQQNVQVLRGYLFELWERDSNLAQNLLDAVLHHPTMIAFIIELHSAAPLDTRGVERLKGVLQSGQIPVEMYRQLSHGKTTSQLAGSDLKDLLLLIADQSGGFNVALEILHMRLYFDRSEQRPHSPESMNAGRELLQHVSFTRDNQRDDHYLAEIMRSCLGGPEDAALAAEIADRLRQAVAANETYSFDNYELIKILLSAHPLAVLDVLFHGDAEAQQDGLNVFDHLNDHQSAPSDEVSCKDLIAWCNRDHQKNYLLAASFVTFARRTEESGGQAWSGQAKVLLANAPDPGSILVKFIERFRPLSWSGSRATLFEANARLLDSLEDETAKNLASIVAEAKARLVREVEEERVSETARDRTRDERFE